MVAPWVRGCSWQQAKRRVQRNRNAEQHKESATILTNEIFRNLLADSNTSPRGRRRVSYTGARVKVLESIELCCRHDVLAVLA